MCNINGKAFEEILREGVYIDNFQELEKVFVEDTPHSETGFFVVEAYNTGVPKKRQDKWYIDAEEVLVRGCRLIPDIVDDEGYLIETSIVEVDLLN